MLALREVWNRTLALLLPARCVGCGALGGYLCADCSCRMVRLQPPLCAGCAMPGWEGVCPACRLQPLALDGVVVSLVYSGVAQKAVHALKYRNRRALAPRMAMVMAQALERSSPTADALVPVPLHARRLRRRGYNQSALLASEVGRLRSIPVWNAALRRVYEGRPQVTLSGRESRWANVAYAFEGTALATGKDLVLVDDVMTTGSTLRAAANALLKAGARSVTALVFARDV